MRTIRSLLVVMGIILAGTFYAAESMAAYEATVAIDIKPGGVPNSINPGSQGKITVAIVSNADFNALALVDRTSLTFGRTGDEPSLAFCNPGGVDVNSDGLRDLLCHFSTDKTGFVAGNTAGILKGRTLTGQAITGTDSVNIVPPAGGPPDTTPPTLVATDPPHGAVGVPVSAAVTAVFSEPMNCATLTNATFLLRDASSIAVPGAVACNSSTATFTPAALLSYSTLYTAMVTTGAKDLAGNAMTLNYMWSFTTLAPPTFSISGMVNLSGGGPLPGVTIALSGAANAATTTAADGFYSFAGLLPGTYTITPSMLGYLFMPATVTITNSNVTQNFTATLADTTPPTVLVTDPTSSAVGVPVTTAVMAVFSEPVDCATVSTATFRLREDTLNSPLVTGTTSCSDATAVFTPSATLAFGMTYRAVLTTGVRDLAGNAMTSSYVWRFTTVAPSPHSITGTISLSGGGALPGAMVALSGAANAATTTAANGSYSFAGLLPGTYTITPSMTGYLFTPATVTITSADVTQDFTAALAVPGYSVSGAVSYAGMKTGRIYVSIQYSGGGSGRGTSLEGPGPFTVRGVPPGTYSVYAWMDTIGNGIQNVANPSGISGTFMVSGSDVPGKDVTLADPVLPAPTAPTGLNVAPMDGAAIVIWNTVEAPNGQGTGATAYRVSWSTDGGNTFPNSVVTHNPNDSVYFHDGLTNGQTLYYRISSLMEGAESAPSPAVGPVTIGALAGGVSVSGTVTFGGNASGHRMWIALVDDKSGQPAFISAVRLADPVSPQSFTISGVQPGNYSLFAFVDMDDNGEISIGDKWPDMNNFSKGLPLVAVSGSDVTGLNLLLPELNATAYVATVHDIRGIDDTYLVEFDIRDQLKRAVKVTVMSGPNMPLPADLDRNWGEFQSGSTPGPTPPAIGDTYTFNVTYSDGTSESLMASVTGVIGPDSMATPTAPIGPGATTIPTLTWAAPFSPPAGGFTYIVGVHETFGPWLWYYPNQGRLNGMPSTQTAVVYNVDGGASQPVLASGATYDWWVQVTDSNANQGRRHATFTTGMGYSISGIVANNSADQSHNILIGACQDAGFTLCSYGALLNPGMGGAYVIFGVPAGTYFLGTCVDSNNDGRCVLGNAEPQAVYSGNPVVVTNTNVTGINMTIPGGIVSYSISGTVVNSSADQTHNILIGACQNAALTICNYGAMLPLGAGGPYVISGVPAGTYYLGTCVDSNGDSTCVLGNSEPQAVFSGNPVVITNTSVSGINMTIPGGVDVTPPSVVVMSPANGTPSAWISAPVTATFSEPVNCSSVTFSLRDAALSAVSGTVMCGGRSATFLPAAPLAYSATYAASIAAGVTDLAGNAMTADALWSFTTSGPPVVGGDYWVVEYGVCPTVWPANPISEYTEDDWAQVRSGTLYNLNWRSRVTVTEPDANGNGTATFTEFWNHRHMVYQGSDPGGVTPGTGAVMATISYKLDPNNEFTMTVNGDTFHMAFSRDYNLFTGVHREGGSNCQDMLLGIKAASAPVTVSGLFSSVNYYNILAFRQGAGMPAPDPEAIMLGTYGQVIWVDQSVPSSRYNATDMAYVIDPTLAGASGHASLQISTPASTGPQTTDADGTLTVAANQGLWHAVSPDGRLRVTAQGTNDSYSPTTDPSGNTTASHMLGSLLSLKQDPNVTFTAADVVGTYFLAARRDDVDFAFPGTIGTTPPSACVNYASDVPGSASCGTGVHPRWRMSWGPITFNADGTASASLTEFNDQQQETPLTATGTYIVRKECFGSSGTGRLPWNDPICSGGRILNVLAVNSGTATIAKFFIGNGGDVLAFYDPTGFAPVAGLAGRSRWTGSAVRLK